MVGAHGSGPDVQTDVWVDGVTFPTSIAPIGEGDALIVEKTGAIRLVRDGSLKSDPIAELDVYAENEAGLLGVAAAPDFAESGEFVVAYTPKDDLEHLYVSRLKLEGDSASFVDKPLLKVPSRPGTDRHFGGNVAYGPDGGLFLSLGETQKRWLAQDPTDLRGSLLRFQPDGSPPEDGPTEGHPTVWAMGLRNPFDFDIDQQGRAWVIDNGRDVNDELNRLSPGDNAGWPHVQGYCDNFPRPSEPCRSKKKLVEPVREFRNSIGPTGVLVYTGELFPSFDGDVFVGGWHSGQVHHFAPTEEGVRRLEPVFGEFVPHSHGDGGSGHGGITDVAQATDGAILIVEANRKGRGIIHRVVPGESDDHDDG
ncbi:MAG: sorbosone dehydrogenase family protein [Bradymonadaceae bacterium]